MDIQWRTIGERVCIGLFFMLLICSTCSDEHAGELENENWGEKKVSECSFDGRQGQIILEPNRFVYLSPSLG